LVEGQERNIAQLERIGAMVEWRWGLKKGLWSNRKKSEDEEDKDEEERSKDSPRESQEKEAPLSVSC